MSEYEEVKIAHAKEAAELLSASLDILRSEYPDAEVLSELTPCRANYIGCAGLRILFSNQFLIGRYEAGCSEVMRIKICEMLQGIKDRIDEDLEALSK